MAKKTHSVTITQFLIIVIPLFLVLPIALLLGEIGIKIDLILMGVWGLYILYNINKNPIDKKPADSLFNSSIERQNKIFIFGILGIIIFMTMFFGFMFYWLKDAAVVEECKEAAFAKGQSVYTTGKVDNETYKKSLEECVKNRKVSFKEFYGDIFGAARNRAEEEKR